MPLKDWSSGSICRALRGITLVTAAIFPVEVTADFWKDVKKAAGNVVDAGIQVTTAPVETALKGAEAALSGGSTQDVLKPYKDLGNSAGEAVSAAADLASDPQNYIYNEALKFSKNAGGDAGAFVFDLGTFNTKLNQDIGFAASHGVSNALKGQNPFQITAAPLAGAIRAARERHISISKPIPDDVKNALSAHFDASTLERARYCVGKIQITLPNFIGQGASYMGKDYAVVVDDIIVFNSEPGDFASNGFWWTHEMTHVDQYRKWGVETFSYNYLCDLGKTVEAEADSTAQRVTGDTTKKGKSQIVLGALKGSHGTGEDPAPVPPTHLHATETPELPVAQCIFPNDPFPVQYLVTNRKRIIAADPVTGNYVLVGLVTPPLMKGVAWSYQTANFRYAVKPNGRIYTVIHTMTPGGPVLNSLQIGHVVKLR